MSHISLRNLAVTYGTQKILNDVTVDIPDGRITAIIGPSGCGKTTLLKSINRLLELNDDVTVRGNVLIDGVDIYDPKTDILSLRKKVGFMSQRPYPLPMSIYDNIAFGPKVHRLTDGQIKSQIEGLISNDVLHIGNIGKKGKAMDMLVECYLSLAGLWDEVKDRLNEPASRLSIGQQQRLSLARALAVEPEVILADEPTSALDPISAQLIERQFRLLKKRYTIVVVTHILRQARRVADYVIFLYLGELVEHGEAGEFFGSPNDKRTRAYISGEIS
ncbi:MAG: phosphate ABC transporter ATP-binding protein [Syntrophorhabdaceae bacterium]|jgi:phosphate transport system ATP-binding protein|nr:phosphate ABC transporter ATP-binding protein [Syntrophorhabdales bacterium]MBP9560872.1 phosphate ABC transporter ATP-binding protein [Syntrophorhabdaceae bacterium]